MQRPRQRRLRVSPPRHKLPLQRPQTRRPANWQPLRQLIRHLCHLIRQLSITTDTTNPPRRCALALCYSIHGRREEETDGFVDMAFIRDGG